MFRTETPWFVRHLPEIGRAFQDFVKLCDEDGVLDRKTKAILMLAASVLQRQDCAEDRLRFALEAGATKAEVTETVVIMALESAEAQLQGKSELYRKYLGGSNGQMR